MTTTNIIVNADDFGMSLDISDAIIRGYDRGVITSTTLMTTAPATEYAAHLAKTRLGLGVGIHLNITSGRPLIDPYKLRGLITADGYFILPNKIPRILLFDFSLVIPILEEFSQQVERCLDLGITPTHCDTHHGMHRFPVVFEAFRRTLKRYRIKAARSQVSLVVQVEPPSTLRERSIDIRFCQDGGMRSAWKRFCMRQMRRSGIRTPDAQLRAELSRLGDVTPLEWFDLLLRYAPCGTFEIVLHPGMPGAPERISDRSLEIRRRDTALVDQSNWPSERLSGRPVRFISYAELAQPTR